MMSDERPNTTLTFLAYCLHQEASKMLNYWPLLTPLLISGIAFVRAARFGFRPGFGAALGAAMVAQFIGLAVVFVAVGGIRYASIAVCWEFSREQRDLVRLTGIDPATLFWCRVSSRWLTICLSIVLILPLVMLARTFGEVPLSQWYSGACALFLSFALTAGFASIAGLVDHQTNNTEKSIAARTTQFLILYHALFGVCAVIVPAFRWFATGQFDLPAGSPSERMFSFILNLAPVSVITRAICSSGLFSPFEPSYWIHLPVAAACLRLASGSFRNAFQITTEGDESKPPQSISRPIKAAPQSTRPRCSDQPFFWKDAYILGRGKFGRTVWIANSFIATLGVLYLVVTFSPLVVAIFTLLVAMSLLAIRFDTLLNAEFREQTWGSLMLLPVSPYVILLAKLKAAVWERWAVFVPVGITVVASLRDNCNSMLMAASIGMLVGILMIQISIVNQFNVKNTWVGSIIGTSSLFIIGFLVIIWASQDPLASFALTIITLSIAAFVLFANIDIRLQNWTE